MSTVGSKKSGKKPVKKLALWGEPEKNYLFFFSLTFAINFSLSMIKRS